MDRFKKRYEKQEQLGEGTYGVVYRALDTFTQQIVAVKRLKMEPYEHDDGIPATAIREFSVLKRMKHRHIVRLLDVNLGVGDG
jgi:serine/threonine protein kinase